MTDKEVFSLLFSSGFNKLICSFKEEKGLTWEQVYAVYCQYFETVQFFASEEGGNDGIQ